MPGTSFQDRAGRVFYTHSNAMTDLSTLKDKLLSDVEYYKIYADEKKTKQFRFV